MSLPDGFLDELRGRTSLAAVAGRKIAWDSRKSNPAKGDYWAACPFHQEKTASFHLDDRKGFYYCFGCHAKGDAVTFVRETENVGFMEAVEILAREAGMEMPARDPGAQEKADRRGQLAAVMEQAVRFYRMQLATAAAGRARDYLAGRGIGQAALDRFEIGYAPDSRTALTRTLGDAGVSEDLIVDAGLAIRPEDGGAPFDRFRGRIQFPIRDSRGRAIAFGGRALDPNARAKYINSPETPLFDKGRTLYNIGPAREAAGNSGTLVVAEGYMDVIALSGAGITHAVAPLGTAVTEHQLALLWRICDEPVIALDGDAAGLRAAMRLVDMALPMLAPGRTLRFCLMPEGQDPDDVVRSGGAGAMEQLLGSAKPLVDMLWQRQTGDRVLDSPERRAAFDRDLRAALGRIVDTSVRAHYAAELRDRRARLFAPARPARTATPGWQRGGKGAAVAASQGAKASELARGSSDWRTEEWLREAVILAACVNHPVITADFESALESLAFITPGFAALRDRILARQADCGGSPETLVSQLREDGLGDALEKLARHRHLATIGVIATGGDPEAARMALAEELAKLAAARGQRHETEDAMQDMSGEVDEGLTWRLGQAAHARDRAVRVNLEGGSREAEEQGRLSRALQDMIDREVWIKKKR